MKILQQTKSCNNTSFPAIALPGQQQSTTATTPGLIKLYRINLERVRHMWKGRSGVTTPTNKNSSPQTTPIKLYKFMKGNVFIMCILVIGLTAQPSICIKKLG